MSMFLLKARNLMDGIIEDYKILTVIPFYSPTKENEFAGFPSG